MAVILHCTRLYHSNVTKFICESFSEQTGKNSFRVDKSSIIVHIYSFSVNPYGNCDRKCLS